MNTGLMTISMEETHNIHILLVSRTFVGFFFFFFLLETEL